MTTVDINDPALGEPESKRHWWTEIERVMDHWGDFLNPILVKETRQALKSRQFAVTFSLVLLTSWLWSLIGIYMRYPGILYSPDGPFLLMGYFDILLFPLIVIIPFSAFRSLASEREDGTFELLSISTLSPRQIIIGKLVSSILQMLVYLSALAPCLGFTYLLRGIDFITIMIVVTLAIMASVFFSALGLVLASITQQRHWQSALSVIVILVFLLLFFIGLGTSQQMIYYDTGWRAFDDWEFWVAMLALFSGYVSFLILVVEVASAQITFESENRTAGVRTVALGQQLLFTGWIFYYWLSSTSTSELLIAFFTIVCLYWYLVGVFLTGESPVISPRVRRSISTFVVERLLLNWRVPGPDRGYFFVVTGLFTAILTCFLITCLAWSWGVNPSRAPYREVLQFGVILSGYTIIYLGLGRMLLRLVQMLGRTDMIIAPILHLVLLLIGCLIPVSWQLLTNQTLDDEFRHWTNPFWFFVKSVDDRGFNGTVEIAFACTVVSVIAIATILANLIFGGRDLVPQRENHSKIPVA